MDCKKEFKRKLSSARSVAFDVMSMLDRMEAECDASQANWGDVGTMNRFCARLEEIKEEIKPYVEYVIGREEMSLNV